MGVMIKPFQLTATEIAKRVSNGEMTMTEVCGHYAERTERFAKELNTHLCWDRSHVDRQIEAQEARLQRNELLPLAGVPVLLKDNICSQELPTTCGSKILEGFKSPYDAHVVERLQAAGAIIFGKANLDEFGMGSSTENSAFGPVRNPWDMTRVPGGSSGGSAAAVAAGMVPVALGSDTGGSVRQPAALCGVVGLKPSYGRVSRYGLIAYGSSLDQIGPITRTVEDAALVLDVISGTDKRDSTCEKRPASRASLELAALPAGVPQPLLGKKIGIITELMADGVEPGTRAAVTAAIGALRQLGATVLDVSLPYLKYSIASYYIIAPAEASANLARYDGIRYGYRDVAPGLALKDLYRRTRSRGFGREVKQRIMLGTFALSSGYYDAYYAKATRARQLIADDFRRVFQEVDVLLSPTSPTTAFKLGERRDDPLAMYLSDISTLAVSLAGLPAISVPAGFDQAGLPVGLQLIGSPFAEEQLCQVAYCYQEAGGWLNAHPSI